MRRIDGSNPQTIADDGIRRGAATLAKNIIGPAELDDFPHGQEIARIIERFDNFELLFYLRDNRIGNLILVAPTRTIECPLAQPLRRSHAVRQLFGWIAIAD